jgi:glycosyltransferase involved in cell wall biosynthesis
LVSVLAELVTLPEFSDVCLVMVGEYKKEVFYSHFGPITEQIEKLGVEGRVIFTGYLPDKDLVVLLNLATALVLPSLMEGFGLPAFEAAACGCPVIATTESPLPALLGEGGVYIDPRRPQELKSALTRVLQSSSLRQRMSRAGREAAGRLTWEAAAEQMLHLIHQVAA